MRKYSKPDLNHAEIRDGLRAIIGYWSVLDTKDVGSGFPDLVVSWKKKIYFLEIKSTNYDDLTPAEILFRNNWPGHYKVIMSLDDALREIGLL